METVGTEENARIMGEGREGGERQKKKKRVGKEKVTEDGCRQMQKRNSNEVNEGITVGGKKGKVVK